MIKEIKYNGYTAQPSDYACADGDLAGMMNLVPDHGTLNAVYPPQTLFNVGEGKKVWYMHKSASPSYRHYIIVDSSNNGVYWLDDTTDISGTVPLTSLQLLMTFGDEPLLQVNAIGNVLMVLCGDGIHYWLWKGADADTSASHYHYLGTHLPELPITFGLQYEWRQGSEFRVDYAGHSLMYAADDNPTNEAFCNTYDDTSTQGGVPNSTAISNRVMGQANKFIADEATSKGRFMYPFLVRYAYRLYDGTYVMQSAPVLMPCVTGCSPIPLVTQATYNGNGDAHGYFESWKLRVTAPVFDLLYRVCDPVQLSSLKDWKDIVSSVDIFVTKPVYTYDINGTIKRNDLLSSVGFSVYGKDSSGTEYTTSLALSKVRGMVVQTNGDIVKNGVITPLPSRSSDAIQADLENQSQFYLLKSYKLDELQSTLTKVEVKADYLQSLVNRHPLDDDYDSHDSLRATYSYVYNSRLNLSGLSKWLFAGFSACSLGMYRSDGPSLGRVWVYINQGGVETVVCATSPVTTTGEIAYLYYPNMNAYKAVVESGGRYLVYPLSNHPYLNGAYYFKGFTPPTETVNVAPSETASRMVSLSSKVYTSQVNNPFSFPATSINTVGTGKVLGIATAAKALSQGQFGQFPLYAFTDEGVWALEVNTSTGGYSARQPITRDVIIKNADGTYNTESITQIDSAVLFATDRGIMLLSGSESSCISKPLDAEIPFTPPTLPYSESIITLAGVSQEQVSYLPFKEFLQGCKMLYDYSHQRIIVYNAGCRYAYVYSLTDKAWGMMQSTITDGVNAYPEAIANTMDNSIVDMSQRSAADLEQGVYGLLWTRPLKLEGVNDLKTIDTIIQRGVLKKDHVKQVLYGSRDLMNWELVWSSKDAYLRGFRGTPYKYFRVCLVCHLEQGESLYGFTVQYTPRDTNQPR